MAISDARDQTFFDKVCLYIGIGVFALIHIVLIIAVFLKVCKAFTFIVTTQCNSLNIFIF